MKETKRSEIPFTFTDKLILRVPALPFDDNIPDDITERLLQNNRFLEAIYLASPVLYRECIKLKEGQIRSAREAEKIKLSLVKYYQRMCSRSTPFGLFSGCVVTSWGEGRQPLVIPGTVHERHTRLDMHYLCSLVQKLEALPWLKNRLCYYPNNTIYIIGDEVRYIEYHYKQGKRVHQISSVANTEYLRAVLEKAANGITVQEAARLLIMDDITAEEAAGFIDELISSQLLVSELEPSVTGPEFIHQVTGVLNKYAPGSEAEHTIVLQRLNEVMNKLAELDQKDYNPIEAYTEIISLLGFLHEEFDESKLFQTDQFRVVQSGHAAAAIQEGITAALLFFERLYREKPETNLQSFIRKFRERYESAAIPLQEVLDTETGIGYTEGTGRDISPLAEDLYVPRDPSGEKRTIEWNQIQQLLFTKLSQAARDKSYSVQFEQNELKTEEHEWASLPPSLSVMFRLIDGQQNRILVESIGGSSAANLLGRFAHGNKQTEDLVKEITTAEKEMNPDVVFAEVAHLPEGRTGNILLRPVFRDYEIPYLSGSSLPPEQQIPLSDLLVTVEAERVKLFSVKLNKEIIPRLSSAHNFTYNALPVYQFLCDLQTQNLRHGFAFHWGSLAGQYKFLPRVELGNTILQEASWQFEKSDFEELVSAIEKNDPAALSSFISRWQMPRYLVLADNDNELLVDTASRLSLLTFAQAVKNRRTVLLKEFLFDTSGAVTDENGRLLINQFIASLVKKEKVYTSNQYNRMGAIKHDTAVRRKFEPGSEWLYCKFYCGSKSADKILTGLIAPLAEQWQRDGLIRKWFFIRYSDPSFHLRVRFHLNDPANTGLLLAALNNETGNRELAGFIWKMQTDTYQRELERYDAACMELAEELFYQDSLSTVKFLAGTSGDDRETIRWNWGITMADALLDAMAFPLESKQIFFHQLKDSYGLEFNADKNLLLQINKKYNAYKPLIKNLLSAVPEAPDETHTWIKNEATAFKTQVQPLVQEVRLRLQNRYSQQDLYNLAGSYVHMMLNRLFPSESRFQEYILYEFMNRYYLSTLKQQVPVTKDTTAPKKV